MLTALVALIAAVTFVTDLAASDRTAPPLREQISLNGQWDEGGRVPTYAGQNFRATRTYARTVNVPAGWQGKRIKLEFGMVQHVAEVYVNDEQVIRHVGGWMPFAIDITERVKPGERFNLRVDVTGSNGVANEDGKFIWPVGGWAYKAGIADDVWLRAYGDIYIEDAFIQTSVQRNTLAVTYTLHNTLKQNRRVTLQGEVTKPGENQPALRFNQTVAVPAGQRAAVTVTTPWANPELYWPDQPTMYHLTTRLDDLDQETRRFGFREITIRGNQYYWNGVRINLYGDYQFDSNWYTNPKIHEPKNWPATIDLLKSMNNRVLRWHHNPPPRYMLDMADEKGLLICSEAPNYARTFLVGTDQETYIANAVKQVEPWIISSRNHPSIYIWTATNEMTYKSLGDFTVEHCLAIGRAIKALDPTRPVGYDGDRNVPSEVLILHYPEGYNREPRGSIYRWHDRVDPARPTGAGEVLHAKSPDEKVQTAMERNKWWLGIWLRGMRYNNFTDVRPAQFWFAHKDLESSDPLVRIRGENMVNAFAPVALFDKEYDDLGIEPFVTDTTPGGTLPELGAGQTAERTLILYNDEFRDTTVTVTVQLRIGDTVHVEQTREYQVQLGEHVDIPYRFVVPRVQPGQKLDLVLMTSKAGEQRFKEVRQFTVAGNASARPAPPTLILDNAKAPQYRATGR